MTHDTGSGMMVEMRTNCMYGNNGIVDDRYKKQWIGKSRILRAHYIRLCFMLLYVNVL
jgi:hypothetical protein